ncbi:MAG TPA: methyl-accepting chemotaxis protein [Dongiaceae bacterium]|nr:methyl-accepting chemotaxis protein [Dongiaceae bacterium]
MHAFRDLSFRLKVSLPIVIITLMFLASSVSSLLQSRELAENAEQIVRQHLPDINYILQADRDLYQAQIAERSIIFLPTGSTNLATYEAQFQENIQQARDRVQKFFDNNTDSRWRSYSERFDTHYRQWLDLASRNVRTRMAGQTIEGDPAAVISATESAFQDARKVLDELTQLREEDAQAITDTIEHNTAATRRNLMAMLVVGLAVCGAALLFVPPMLVKPLHSIRERLMDISEGSGDLTARIDLQQQDEFGHVVRHFNQFMQKLQILVKQIKDTATEVAGSSTQMHQDAQSSKDAIDHQGDALTLVATAVNQMSAAIQEVARNTTEAADEAKKASTRSEEGQRIVHDTIVQIQQLAEQVQTASSVIAHVESEASKVTSVIDVIRGIAEQTNLLALNAAIEAARAGEQGRGFAVVADEVRTLASRTQESTRDIQNMLQHLQQGVKEAVVAMNTSRSSAISTVQTTEGAGKTLDDIKEAVSNITRMAIQIAAAAEEQSEVTEDINRNLTQINHFADTTAGIAKSTLQSSDKLSGLTRTLNQTVQSFRV